METFVNWELVYFTIACAAILHGIAAQIRIRELRDLVKVQDTILDNSIDICNWYMAEYRKLAAQYEPEDDAQKDVA